MQYYLSTNSVQSSRRGWGNFSIKDQVVKTFSFVGYISPCHLLFACFISL